MVGAPVGEDLARVGVEQARKSWTGGQEVGS